MDRSALVARNEAVWDALASAFAGADARASEATRPGPWSAKDHLSHVVAWERHRLAVLRGDDFAAAMGLTPEVWAAADEDEVNALIAERTTGQSVATVLADVHTIRTAVGDAVREAPDERLATTYRTMHPEDDERGDGPVGEWAVGIAEAHVGAHLGPIRARLAEARGERPPSVTETLARIDAATEAISKTLIAVADLAAPDADGWRAADHAFHVAAWDRGCAALLTGQLRWTAIGITEAIWRDGDVHRANAAIFAANRVRPAMTVVAALRESRTALREAVATLEDDDLLAAYGAFQPDDRPMDFAPVYEWVAENGWVHPAEHAEAIARIDADVG
jgi:hypothetical protein